MRVKAAAALWPFVHGWRESEREGWDGIDAALAAAPLADWLQLGFHWREGGAEES